jgi:hypothetical protein
MPQLSDVFPQYSFCFQQVRAPPHCHWYSHGYLDEILSGSWIECGGLRSCSPKSLDIDPEPIILLPMGLWEEAVYIPSLLQTFKDPTTGVNAAVKSDILQSVWILLLSWCMNNEIWCMYKSYRQKLEVYLINIFFVSWFCQLSFCVIMFEMYDTSNNIFYHMHIQSAGWRLKTYFTQNLSSCVTVSTNYSDSIFWRSLFSIFGVF